MCTRITSMALHVHHVPLPLPPCVSAATRASGEAMVSITPISSLSMSLSNSSSLHSPLAPRCTAGPHRAVLASPPSPSSELQVHTQSAIIRDTRKLFSSCIPGFLRASRELQVAVFLQVTSEGVVRRPNKFHACATSNTRNYDLCTFIPHSGIQLQQ